MFKLLKNKMFLILLISVTLILSVFSSSFAANEDVVYFHDDFTTKDITVKLPSRLWCRL